MNFQVQLRNGEYFCVFEKIAFEEISLNTHFYRERIVAIQTQYVKNSLKISDIVKKEFFEMIFIQIDKKI